MLKPKNQAWISRLSILALLLVISSITDSTNLFAAAKSETAEDYRAQGYEEQQKGNLNDALTFYSKAISLGLKNPNVLNDMGVLYEQLGIFGKALGFYQQAIKIDPYYLPPYMNLAYLNQRLNRVGEARKYFEKRYQLASPEDPWGQKAREELLKIDPVYYRQKFVDEDAKRLKEELIRKAHDEFYYKVNQATNYYDLGTKLLKQGKYKEAQKQLNEALNLTPENPKIVNALVDSYVKIGNDARKDNKFTESLYAYDEALKLHPQDSQLKETRNAIKREVAKDNIKKSGELAAKMLDSGDVVGAQLEIENLANNFSQAQIPAPRSLGNMSAKDKRPDFERRVALAVSYYQQAESLAENDQLEEAIALFDRSLKLIPQNSTVQKAKKKAALDLARQTIEESSQRALESLGQGNRPAAKEEFQKALNAIDQDISLIEDNQQLNPKWFRNLYNEFDQRINKAETLYKLGQSQLDANKYQEALGSFEHALGITPNSPKYLAARQKAKIEVAKAQVKQLSDQTIQNLDKGETVNAKTEAQKILTAIPDYSYSQ